MRPNIPNPKEVKNFFEKANLEITARLIFGAGCGYTPDKGTMEEAFDAFMNKVQPPTQWQVEIEMEFDKTATNLIIIPKITNNSITIKQVING